MGLIVLDLLLHCQLCFLGIDHIPCGICDLTAVQVAVMRGLCSEGEGCLLGAGRRTILPGLTTVGGTLPAVCKIVTRCFHNEFCGLSLGHRLVIGLPGLFRKDWPLYEIIKLNVLES